MAVCYAASNSDEAAARYISSFYNGQAIDTIIAPPSERGRFFSQPTRNP